MYLVVDTCSFVKLLFFKDKFTDSLMLTSNKKFLLCSQVYKEVQAWKSETKNKFEPELQFLEAKYPNGSGLSNQLSLQQIDAEIAALKVTLRHFSLFQRLSPGDKAFLAIVSLTGYTMVTNDVPLLKCCEELELPCKYAEEICVECFNDGSISQSEMQDALDHWKKIKDEIFLKNEFRKLGFNVY